MKAERNQDGSYTIQVSECELNDMRRVFSIYSLRLILEKPEGGEWLDWPKDEREFREALSNKLNSYSKELLTAYEQGWYRGRRLEPGEVIPERLAA